MASHVPTGQIKKQESPLGKKLPRALLAGRTLTTGQSHIHPLKGQVPGEDSPLGPTHSHVHNLICGSSQATPTICHSGTWIILNWIYLRKSQCQKDTLTLTLCSPKGRKWIPHVKGTPLATGGKVTSLAPEAGDSGLRSRNKPCYFSTKLLPEAQTRLDSSLIK